MIKNIIFDIGNVLAWFRWKDYARDLGFSEEMVERVGRATVRTQIWRETDRGVLSIPEAVEQCIALDPEIEDEIRLFYKDRRELVTEYDYSEGLIRDLKARGYKVYLLSNYSEDHFQYILSKFRFFGLEDGMVISYREKVLKPEPEIYNILFERYGLKPEECVFLDDTEVNIETAVKLGMRGIVFKNYEQGIGELERILSGEQ